MMMLPVTLVQYRSQVNLPTPVGEPQARVPVPVRVAGTVVDTLYHVNYMYPATTPSLVPAPPHQREGSGTEPWVSVDPWNVV